MSNPQGPPQTAPQGPPEPQRQPEVPVRRSWGSGKAIVWLLVGVGLVALLVSTKRITTSDIVIFCVIIPSVILHEVAHGWVALAFGDDTAKRAGRLTLNPIAHVDVVGTLIVPAFMILSGFGFFGWAKPVPVNLAKLRSPRNQGVVVSLAGPATNLVLAGVFAVLFRASGAASAIPVQGPLPIWVQLLFYAGIINIWLAAFNMIPIPPLDGSVLLERLLPRSWWPHYLRIRPYTLPVLLAVVVLASTAHVNLFGSFETTTFNWWARVLGVG